MKYGWMNDGYEWVEGLQQPDPTWREAVWEDGTPSPVFAEGTALKDHILKSRKWAIGAEYVAVQATHYEPGLIADLGVLQPSPYIDAVRVHIGALRNAQTAALAAIKAALDADDIAAARALQPAWPTDPAPQPEDF